MPSSTTNPALRSNSLVSIQSISIILASLLACVFLLVLERLVGLRWDFHPDAANYIEYSALYADNVRYRGDYIAYLNVGYYVLVDALGSSILAATALNMLLFALTNSMIAHIFFNYWQKLAPNTLSRAKRQWFYVFLFLILFDPYRIHLSISVLKDTTLLFLLVTFLSVPRKFGVLLIPLIASIRIIAPIYLMALLRGRNKVYISLLVLVAILALLPFVIQFVELANRAEMQFRSFDRVPTFQGLGIWGALLRASTWPILYMSGLFLFLSPNALFVPIFFQVIVVMMFRRLYTKWKPWNSYFMLFGIALVVTGFTAYVRYALPILYFTLLVEMRNYRPVNVKSEEP